MRAKMFNSRDKQMIVKLAMTEIDKKSDDIAIRAQALWCMAALNAGHRVSTINKIMHELPAVIEAYGEYKCDGVGDYALFKKLKEKGIDIGVPKNEIG